MPIKYSKRAAGLQLSAPEATIIAQTSPRAFGVLVAIDIMWAEDCLTNSL